MPHCKICLDNEADRYQAGDQITGKVTLNLDGKTKLRCVKIKLSGKEHTEFMGTGTKDGKSKDTLVQGDNDVIIKEVILFGSSSSTSSLPAGEQVYPFTFQLPTNLPGSYSCEYGTIIYKLKATVDRPMAFDYDDEVVITVVSPVNLNLLGRSDLLDGTSLSVDKSICCWFCTQGPISMTVEVPQISLVPGETVKIDVKVTNRSKSKIECIKLKLNQKVTCCDDIHSADRREIKTNILELSEAGVDPGGENTCSFNVILPINFPVLNFTLCQLFKVDYVYKIIAKIRGLHTKLEVQMCPEVGTIQYDPAIAPPVRYSHRISRVSTPSIGQGYTPRSSQGYTPRNSEGYNSTNGQIPSSNSTGNFLTLPTVHSHRNSQQFSSGHSNVLRNLAEHPPQSSSDLGQASQSSENTGSTAVVTLMVPSSAPPAYETLELN